MTLSKVQKIQLETLSLFGIPGDSIGISSVEAAERLEIRDGTVRQRLIRYEREGWLERTPVQEGQGFEYRITERGIARLDWLRTQKSSGNSWLPLPWLAGGAAVALGLIFLKRLQGPPPDKDKGGNHA